MKARHSPTSPDRDSTLGWCVLAMRLLAGGCLWYGSVAQAASVALTHDLSGNLNTVAAGIAATPTFVVQPLSVSQAAAGSAVSFSVNVASSSPVTYQWQFNNQDINGATGDTLFLPNVTVANEGSYTVIVTNSTSSATSDPAVLSVNTQQVIAWGRNDHGQSTVPAGLNHVVAIATSGLHSLVLKSDGTVAAWGYNDSGQSTVPVGLTGVVAIAAGYHSLALKSDGTMVGWGYNGYGQTTIPAGLTNVRAIAAGDQHSVALKADGTVVAWGYNYYGQTNVPPGLNSVVAIAAGGITSMALKSDGTVVQWGDVQNGFGSTLKPANLGNVVAIATGGSSTCMALKADGTVVVWGSGQGVSMIPPTLSNVVAIAAGGVHCLALKADGSVVGWGYDSDHQVGPSLGLRNIAAVAAGGSCSLALRAEDQRVSQPVILNQGNLVVGLDSSLHYRINAQNHPTSYAATGLPDGLVIDTNTGLITGTPTVAGTFSVTLSATNASGTTQFTLTLIVNIPVPSITLALLPPVAAGNPFSFHLTASNSPTLFNATGLPLGLNLNQTTGEIAGTSADVGSHAVQLSATNSFGTGPITTLTLNVQTIIAWGYNYNGQTNVPAGLGNAVAIAAGYAHGLALKADGTVAGWGDPYNGGPTIPAGLNNVVAIAAGNYTSLALRSTGTLVAWGDNYNGVRTIPAGLSKVIAIALRGTHSLALKADGTVVAWGSNGYGESNVPAGLTNVMAIAAGYYFSVALKADGTVVAWGYNGYGQTTIPVGLTGVVAIAAGENHVLAMKSDETVVGWGSNGYGESTLPGGLGSLAALSAGSSFSIALKADGTMAAWGANSSGESTIIPAGVNNALAISASHSYGAALLSPSVADTKPVILNPPFALAGINSVYRSKVLTLNNPTSFGATGLPAGLTINTSTGFISGTPTVSGMFAVTLSATNASGTRTRAVALTVLSLGTPDIGVQQPADTNLVSGNNTVNFGSFTLGGSATLTFTVKNTGNANLSVDVPSIDGTDSADFAITANPAANVAAAGSTTFKVKFLPTTSGSKTATLHITSNDPDESPFDVAVTGIATPPPGALSIDGTSFTVNENSFIINIPIKRTGGSYGTVTAKLSTSNGTAAAPGDFYALSNATVTLGDGVTSTTKQITIINSSSTSEPNQTFTVTLSSPTGGATLGTPTKATVVIIDSSSLSNLTDTKPPPPPTILSPTINALLSVEAGGSINVTGTASDTQGVKRVLVSIDNGMTFSDAALGTMGAVSTSYTCPVIPVTGANTVLVKTTDYAGNVSAPASRSFTVMRRLTVSIAGPPNSGSVTAGFMPSSFRKIGTSYVIAATPKTGFFFDGWTANSFTGTGVTDDTRHKTTLTFTMVEGLVLTANFIPQPFPPLAGTYYGLVLPSGIALPGTNANGYLKVTLTTAGSFTANLTLDGSVLPPFIGSFDSAGIGRFGTNLATSIVLTRTGRPNLQLTLTLDMTDTTKTLVGTVNVVASSVITATSTIEAHRAVFSTTHRVDPYYTPKGTGSTATGSYTIVFQHLAQTVALDGTTAITPAEYPQGDGYGTVTLTAAGAVTMSGVLADGTAVSGSAGLSQGYDWPWFNQLYTAKGCAGGWVVFNKIPSDTDLTSSCFWLRPPLTGQQYYPNGWPKGIALTLAGARYLAVTGSSVLPLLGLSDANGNANLTFTDGLLIPTPLTKTVGISIADLVTHLPADTSYTLTITRTTGAFSGTFTHSDGKKPAFNGRILQKGSTARGRGYFLSVKPTLINGLGQSGAASLSAQ